MKKSSDSIVNTLLIFLILFLNFGLSINGKSQLNKVIEHYDSIQKTGEHHPQSIQFVQKGMNIVEDNHRLSQIILIRHGEPALNKKGWRTRKEARQFIRNYDSAGVYPPHYKPLILQENELKTIYTSSLNRSISTAQQVFNGQFALSPDSLFREFERKIFVFPNIKLPLKWWLTGSRILWFTGINNKNIESFSQAKSRARKASDFLAKNATNNGKTLLVSHGLLNHYLAKYLEKNGWILVYDGGRSYLSQKVLIKYEVL